MNDRCPQARKLQTAELLGCLLQLGWLPCSCPRDFGWPPFPIAIEPTRDRNDACLAQPGCGSELSLELEPSSTLEQLPWILANKIPSCPSWRESQLEPRQGEL